MIKKIKVGGHIYSVLFPYIFRERTGADGQCDDFMKEIRLSKLDPAGNKLAQSYLEYLIWHEILHAINYVYNNNSIEEAGINHIAEGLFQVMKDNFDFSFLIHELKGHKKEVKDK